MRKQQHIFSKAFVVGLAFAIFATGCTKKRDAALPEGEEANIFAISDFGTNLSGFRASAKTSERAMLEDFAGNKASEEKGLVNIETVNSGIPNRLHFMFDGLEISGQEQDIKIVFGVDSKFVTAYKMVSGLQSLTKLEKQLAVSPEEVRFSIELQKASNSAAKKTILVKAMNAQKMRTLSLMKNTDIDVLIPLFKYQIQAKGVLERVKNELRENTSTLSLKGTEFTQATHIKLDTSSEARKDIGSIEQKKALDQLFTTESLDNKAWTALTLQSRYAFNMKFVADDAQVFTRLDSRDMKVFQILTLKNLNKDEQRQYLTGNANGEILKCAEAGVKSADKDCVLRLVATVPISYKNLNLNVADSRSNTGSILELNNVSKNDSKGLVEIVNDSRAERARPTGIIDPLNTIKISDLKGEFYFRRTFEDASNTMLESRTGTSGDMSVVRFEFGKNNVVVRNQKALIQYIGQGPKDKEELINVPVKYFRIETIDNAGVKLAIPKLIDATSEEAEYIEIDWTKNTVPIANSPLAFFAAGKCWQANTSTAVEEPDNRLTKDGILNFSIAGSYTVKPDCANQARVNDAYFSLNAQFNYNVVERLSFRKRTQAQIDDTQFAPNISPMAQASMNFAIFTLADTVSSPNVRNGREGSEVYKPVIHDFRNGKVLNYWVGGLKDVSAERKAIIQEAAKEVITEWNEAFRRAFKDTAMYRASDYLVLNSDDESKQHLGDLDKNYLWFNDKVSENGLLGVAQPAPNPYSGTIIANNVIVYSGNTERQIRAVMANLKESRDYENLLEVVKQNALADLKKRQEEDKKKAQAAPLTQPNSSTVAPVSKKVTTTNKALNQYVSYISRLALSARPVKPLSPITKSNYGTENTMKLRTVLSDINLPSNKSFALRVLEEELASDFKNDPMMLEAIIARELARSQPGLSEEVKSLLQRKAALLTMSAKFDHEARKRGSCMMYAREGYNDRYLAEDFNHHFKTELKETLLHEVGHALGLVHNFKGSFDRKNFAFDGEKTNRNYTSIMDYIAGPEMEYQGPGTYDVHALRSIYTGLVEISATAKSSVAGSKVKHGKLNEVSVVAGKFVALADVKKALGQTYWNGMQKRLVNDSGLLKHYEQCNDGEVGSERACTRYDSGSTATQVVQNMIKDYNRMYTLSYTARDRVKFGWEQKISAILRARSTFQGIRAYLDEYIKMLIFGDLNAQAPQADIDDFETASQLGYDFFHTLIRTPDTKLSVGKTAKEMSERFLAIAFTDNIPLMKKDSAGNDIAVRDENRMRRYNPVESVKIIERKALYDVTPVRGENQFDTIGISFDKEFALECLMRATPKSSFDNSVTGWFSYNEFEKYILKVGSAENSLNMITLFDIMNGSLRAGFMDSSHELKSLGEKIIVNRSLLDTAVLGSLSSTNMAKSSGLDTFAEFFKVGTLKAGRSLTDRATVTRFGQSSQSQTGIKFFAADNATGADILVTKAGKKSTLLEHKQVLSKAVNLIFSNGIAINSKLAALTAITPSEDAAKLMKTNPELKKLMGETQQVSAELTILLTALNTNGAIASAEEIKKNPNYAIDKQVGMLVGMTFRTAIFFDSLVGDLKNIEIEKLSENGTFNTLDKNSAQNAQLADLDLLGFAQDIMIETIARKDGSIKMKDGRNMPEQNIIKMIVPGGNIQSQVEDLMVVIEDLARYTSKLNPEYVQ